MDYNVLVPIIKLGYELIVEDDDNEAVTEVEKTWNFAEITVPRFNDKQFKEHFRFNPNVFFDLLKRLNSCDENISSLRGHPQLSLDKQVMMTLLYLGNMESFRSVASRFGVTKSTCWDVISRICLKLLKVNEKYKIICWCTRGQAIENMEKFRNINNFPGVIGAIDGCHIRILPPKEYSNSYYNRKKFHSILLQGVCNKDKLFIDVYAGEPGSIHDANLFHKSDLSQRINYLEFPNDGHIIGDLAYPISRKLLVGYKDVGNLNPQKKFFNLKLSILRVCIEHAFALLKGRFRRLKFMEARRLDLISLMTVAACILHNLCILHGDLPDHINFEEELNQEREQNIENIFEEGYARNRIRREGEEKRERIANMLYANRNQ